MAKGKGKDKGTIYPGAKRNLYDVPYGAYDPALDAQERASGRGLSDLREDTRTAGSWAKKDLKTDLFNINRGWRRGKQDMRRGYRRNRQKLGFQRQDLNRSVGRARQDFRTRLLGIGRQFNTLAASQQEAQNAAGVLGGGTVAAAAAKRAENQRFAEQPIHTAQHRTEQDYTRNMGRLNVAGNQLRQDFRQGWKRGRQDVRQNRMLTNRAYNRGVFSRNRKLGRGIREYQIGRADILAQKIDSARQRNPGSFNKYGRKK